MRTKTKNISELSRTLDGVGGLRWPYLVDPTPYQKRPTSAKLRASRFGGLGPKTSQQARHGTMKCLACWTIPVCQKGSDVIAAREIYKSKTGSSDLSVPQEWISATTSSPSFLLHHDNRSFHLCKAIVVTSRAGTFSAEKAHCSGPLHVGVCYRTPRTPPAVHAHSSPLPPCKCRSFEAHTKTRHTGSAMTEQPTPPASALGAADLQP
jgi:hypothetical protein